MSMVDAEQLAELKDCKQKIMDLLGKWETLINKVSMQEIQLYELKEEIFQEEQDIIKNTDFNALYGKNNKDVRKEHLDKTMKPKKDLKKSLEIDIEANKRRVIFYGEKVKCLRQFMRE